MEVDKNKKLPFNAWYQPQLSDWGVAADIVGHEKQTITFGLYSGGNQLEVKREAIEKVKYPFPTPHSD